MFLIAAVDTILACYTLAISNAARQSPHPFVAPALPLSIQLEVCGGYGVLSGADMLNLGAVVAVVVIMSGGGWLTGRRFRTLVSIGLVVVKKSLSLP